MKDKKRAIKLDISDSCLLSFIIWAKNMQNLDFILMSISIVYKYIFIKSKSNDKYMRKILKLMLDSHTQWLSSRNSIYSAELHL